jgi:lauroyl/myristoyl acyltransferase
MRFFSVWVYLSWLNATGSLVRELDKIGHVRNAIVCWMLRHLPYGAVLRMFRCIYVLPFVGRKLKNRAYVADANKRTLLNKQGQKGFVFATQRRLVMDMAATWGQNRQILAEIAQCRKQLNNIVEPLHMAGKPVILAPLHMVSDVLAGIVGSGLTPGKTTVIVSSSVEVFQLQARSLGGIDLDYCSIHDDNREIAGNLMEAIMEAAELKRNIMIFPDITPDYTVNTNPDGTAKMSCQLFGRSAHLHSGILRIARMLAAEVVFYHLYDDGGLKLQVFAAVNARNLKKMMPEIIETSIRQHPDDWMLWHAHSLFFINE